MGAIIIRTRYVEGTESAEVATSGVSRDRDWQCMAAIMLLQETIRVREGNAIVIRGFSQFCIEFSKKKKEH